MGVYFVANKKANSIKIGKSKNAAKRLEVLQGGSPEKLEFVALLPGDYEAELEWHKRWSHLRRNGEWFEITPELLGAISNAVATSGEYYKPHYHFVACAARDPRVWFPVRRALVYRVSELLSERFCANSVWYGYNHTRGIKRDVCELAGWERQGGPPELATQKAYDAVYTTAYESLPDCKGQCACVSFMEAALT